MEKLILQLRRLELVQVITEPMAMDITVEVPEVLLRITREVPGSSPPLLDSRSPMELVVVDTV